MGVKKERVVILGSGWGGYTLSRNLSAKLFSPLIISPRPYFLFTPLLTDTAGGSLDFSHVIEPVRVSKSHVGFIQAQALSVNFSKKRVICKPAVIDYSVNRVLTNEEEEEVQQKPCYSEFTEAKQWEGEEKFEVSYDKLVISVGAVTNTFNTPGVRENATFFKDIGDSRQVRHRVRECFELAMLPTATPEMQRYLLHFAIVGAGPTGTELAASLRDLIHSNFITQYPSLIGIPRISLYDVAPKVLSMFDEQLSQYAMQAMKKEGIDVKTSHHVEGLRWGAPGDQPPHGIDAAQCLTLKTKERGEEGIGVCVWVTGNKMNTFIRHGLDKIDQFPASSVALPDGGGRSGVSWSVKKAEKAGSLSVDGSLRVQLVNTDHKTVVLQDVFAIGDNATPETSDLPATAQVAYQEGKWLATQLNKGNLERSPQQFVFKSLGIMAYIGDSKALMQFPDGEDGHRWYRPSNLTGRVAWLVWNSAYITLSISWKNRLRVAGRWLLNGLFGRDASRY